MVNEPINNSFEEQLPSVFFKKILLILLSTLLFIFLLGSVLWYRGKRTPIPQPTTPTVFDPATKIVPQGVVPLEIDQALTAFGLSKPLPFFEKKNVIQSLDLKNIRFSPEIYLSYWIEGRSTTTILEAYVAYFKSIGLENALVSSQKTNLGFVLPGSPPSLLRISLMEQPFASAKSEEIVTVVLTLTPIIQDTSPNQ